MLFSQNVIQELIPSFSLLYGAVPGELTISVDSRTIVSGECFLALEGAKVDGHLFIMDALRNGATGIIMATAKQHLLSSIPVTMLHNVFVALVDDPFNALLLLARFWRTQFLYPVVAVTGSVGKTSTKERIAHILSLNGTVYIASYSNQNTLLYLALNILRMRAHHQVALFEVGISGSGQMAEKAELLRPTLAVITIIGHSHMEGLGALSNISVEKRDIFKYFNEGNIGIINGDQPVLTKVAYSHPVLKFGRKIVNQVQARKVVVGKSSIRFVLKIYHNTYPIVLPYVHLGMVNNALAAAAVTHVLGVPHDIIIKGIEAPLVVARRFQLFPLKKGTGTIIDDCYNASPESMHAALLALEQIEGAGSKVAVLGDMLELGAKSAFWHRRLGKLLRKVPTLNRVILVGDMVQWAKKTAPIGLPIDHVASWSDAVPLVNNYVADVANTVVLVKGSHGMQLQNLVNEFVG